MKTIANLIVTGTLLATPVWSAPEANQPKKPSTGVHPIVYRDASVGGGWVNGAWVEPKDVMKLMKEGELYTFYSLTAKEGQSKLLEVEDTGPDIVAKFEGTDFLKHLNVGVAAPWNALPREPKVEDPNQEELKDEVAKILKQNKQANAPVKIAQVVRIDLEGDGVEEVIVSATNMKLEPDGNPAIDPTAAARGLNPAAVPGNDVYSFVLLRKLVNGQPQTTLLTGSFYTDPNDGRVAEHYRLAAVLDLDGDGVQEIVTHASFFEGDFINVFKMNGAKADEVL
jgi:hypothetical protein